MQKKSRQTKPLLLRGVFPYNKANLAKDIFAGVSLAAIAIPVDMGYAKIAGMPIVTGLYALLLPCLAFALFGASRHLVVGADSASAAILAAGVVALAPVGSSEYASYAALLAMITGILLLLCRVFRLGFIAQFLSRTVLTGFLAGVGIQVALGQLPELLGLSISGNVFEKLAGVFENLPQVNLYAIGMAALTLAIVMLPRRFYGRAPRLKKIPWALIAICISMAVGYALQNDVPLSGTLQSGLPKLSFPAFSADAVAALLGSAISIVVVVITQSEATLSIFAEKHKEEPDANRDILGLGAANIAAGLSGTFVVNGSPTKTEIADEAGGRSQLSNLTAAGIVLIVLLFLTTPFSFLPGAALAAIVFSTALGLMDMKTLREIFRKRRNEFYLALVTMGAVVVAGAAWGIILAIILSLLDHVHRSYKPQNSVFRHEKGDADDANAWKPVEAGVYARPGTVLYHFAASIYYANVAVLKKEIALLTSATPPPAEVVIDFSAVADIDYTGGDALAGLYEDLKGRGIALSIVLIKPSALEELKKYGIIDLVGKENIYPSMRSVLHKID